MSPADLRALADLASRLASELAVDRCSFCGALRSDVRTLVATERAMICDECVVAASRLVANDKTGASLLSISELTNLQFVRSHDVERHGGLVYAVATVPDLDVRRVKIGYTTRPIENRLDAFRTVNPTASLIGLWSAPSDGEDVALRMVDGRLKDTEVFHVPDVAAALAALDEEMRKRWP